MGKLHDHMTIKEAAEFLGVSPNTLRNWEVRSRFLNTGTLSTSTDFTEAKILKSCWSN